MAIERFVHFIDGEVGEYDLQVYDAENNIIKEQTTVLVETFDDSNSPLWDDTVCSLAVRAGGVGTAFTTSGKPRVFFQTDVNGLLQIEVVDVAAGSISGFLLARPFSQLVTNFALRYFSFTV